jgi:hypothetical protein
VFEADRSTVMQLSLVSLLFASGIALLPFGAVYWPESLGTLAASPGLLLILAAILIAPFLRPRYMPIFRLLRFKRLLLIPIAGSFLSLSIFGWNNIYALKFFSVGMLSLLWLSPLLLIDYLKIRHLRLAVVVGICLCLIGYVISDVLNALPSNLRSLVFGPAFLGVGDARPRGFAEEASQFSATVSRLFIIYYLIYESNRRYSPTRLIGFLFGLALTLVLLGSKGAVVGIAVALLSFTLGRRNWHYFILAFPVAWWLANSQIEAISIDLEQFTSTATRATMLLTGLVSILINPLGWGYYGFYGAIQTFGMWSLRWIDDRFPALLFFEARDIIEELNNVSTKSTPLDFMMTFGWLFVWLMVKIVEVIRFHDPRVRACWIYVLITSLSTSGHLSILTFLTLAVMLRLYPRHALAPVFQTLSCRPAKR